MARFLPSDRVFVHFKSMETDYGDLHKSCYEYTGAGVGGDYGRRHFKDTQ